MGEWYGDFRSPALGPSGIMAQGISTHGPIDTSFNCS